MQRELGQDGDYDSEYYDEEDDPQIDAQVQLPQADAEDQR